MTMAQFNPQVIRYLRPDEIEKHLAELHPGVIVTKGSHESLVPGYIPDLEWNFYDELHRYYVHDTYHGMYKVMTGKYFSVNVVRWGNLPVFMQVANAKIADGMFYQSMTVLGIIMLHQVQTITQQDEQVLIHVDFYVASHWLFKVLHRPFAKRLLKLQRKQDEEDNNEIRYRRRHLRQEGFSFLIDDPDFINSNRLTDHVRFPPFEGPFKISVDGLVQDTTQPVKVGPIELLLRRQENGDVHVWPGLCPHEGAGLDESDICSGVLRCPWHGRKFPGALLRKASDDVYRHLSITVRHDGDNLIVEKEPAAR
jgi:nitrite reductase/ring-hydroxylating ferredoxin subunit